MVAQSQPAVSAAQRILPGHLPAWASNANLLAPVPAELPLDRMTIILARSPLQQQAFEAFLADQQNPASSEYHHWLTPAEIADRFGPSSQDTASVTLWLRSQGLQVASVSNSRTFVGFSGTAADVARAFHTEFRYYAIDGKPQIANSSDPIIPASLAPVIKAIHGLYTVEDRPLHYANPALSPSPEMNSGSGAHYLTPEDVARIYNLPSSTPSGRGVSIGIVGRARVNTADLDNFRNRTGAYFPNPTEIVPTAYGGVDPGAAYTAPPGSGVSTGDQGEATLDVMRAGSVAVAANLQLVVATSASGGVEVAAEYLVDTTPVPVQIISVSFGMCESKAGSSNVTFWDTLFQQAAAEGISSFVASGDSGASGCDAYFATPPASPAANSPNYICSSSYATCVGGTEFNDASNPAAYWYASNDSALGSAIGYIPEGAWNEPLNSSSKPQAAATGGGVSSFIATPSWQTGTGVPSARAGRYTPDIAFSAAGHDGYFACFAAAGASCVANGSGQYTFEYFMGTSAAAPEMAGIAALLDEKLASPQGNLNPQLYQLAASAPSAFHDVTPATSGVVSCNINTPSMCNNSIPSSTGLTGGQAGFPVTAGFDEATGLGSLNVSNFLSAWTNDNAIQPASISPAPLVFPTTWIGYPAYGTVTLTNPGLAPITIATVTVTGANASSFIQGNSCGSSLAGKSSCAVQIQFSPTTAGPLSATLTITDNAPNSPQTVALSGFGIEVTATTPSATPSTVPIGGPITLTATVLGFAPTGSVVFSRGSTILGTVPVVSGSATLAGVVATSAKGFGVGANLISASYSGDAYNLPSTGTFSLPVYDPALPLLLSLSSTDAFKGNSFTLCANGANFTPNSTVLWNGLVRPTTYLSAQQLTAQISAADTAQETVARVSVTNPAPKAGTSIALPVIIYSYSLPPSVTSVSLSKSPNSNGYYPVSVIGNNLTPEVNVSWNNLAQNFSQHYYPEVLSFVISSTAASARPATINLTNYAGKSLGFIFP